MRAALVIVACLASGLAVAAATERRGAPAALDECDALVRESPNDLAPYQCYWFVGRNQAVLEESAGRLETILTENPTNHRARLYLGIIAADLGQPRTEGLLREAALNLAVEGETRGEIYSRITLSMWLRRQGRNHEASAELDKALEAATASGDAEIEAQVRINLGWQRYSQREYGRAWEILRQAESLLFPDGPERLRLDALDALGAVSWALGRDRAALDYYQREVDLLRGGDPYRESGIRRNMALVARGLGEEGTSAAEIDRLYRDAVDAAVRAKNRYAEAGARLMLASTLEGPEGVGEAREGLAAAREVGSVADICWGLWLVGEKSLKLNPDHPELAFAYLEEAIDLARESGDPESLSTGLLLRSSMRWKAGPRSRAIQESFEGLEAVEGIRSLQEDGEVKARVFGRFARAYRVTAGRLLETSGTPPSEGDIESAFNVTERMRARSLLDILDAAGVRVEADATFAVLRESALPGMGRIQEALDKDQAFVSFLIPSARGEPESEISWATVVTSGDAHAVRLGEHPDLPRRIRLYLSLLERRDDSDAAGARRLYRDLLEPVVEILPDTITTLFVVPDGPLHRLPLGALVDDAGMPVAERYTITVIPSAATWLRFRGEGRSTLRRSPLIAFADPALRAGEGDDASRGDLGRLPHARLEAATLRRHLGGGDVLHGEDATEAALKGADLARYGVVHFASHAVVNDEYPERSAIMLAPDDSSGGDDGVVRFDEVVGLDLNGQVVVLSACRSASGPMIGGEGVMGLANAFFQAGARTVVAGLWPVRDRETAALVDRFGVHLGDGRTVAEAMALARRDLIRKGGPPAAWAGMVVLGDGDVVSVAGGSSSWDSTWSLTIVLLGFVVTTVAVILASRLRKRRSNTDYDMTAFKKIGRPRG